MCFFKQRSHRDLSQKNSTPQNNGFLHGPQIFHYTNSQKGIVVTRIS